MINFCDYYYAYNNIPEYGFDQIDFIMKENLKDILGKSLYNY